MIDGQESSVESASKKLSGDQSPDHNHQGQSQERSENSKPPSPRSTSPIRSQPTRDPRIVREATKEFKAWKVELTKMIKAKSRIVYQDDGSYSFLLPPDLVRLVWGATVKERAAFLRLHGKGNASEFDALEDIRNELTRKAMTLVKRGPGSVEEEEEAAAKLAEIRAEIVAGRL